MALTHTSALTPLARGAHDRLLPEDLDLDARSRRVWLAIVGDDATTLAVRLMHTPVLNIMYRLCRKAARSCPLELCGRLIVWLAVAGFSEAQLRQLPRFLDEVIDDVYVGAGAPSLDDLDLQEQHVEGQENELATLRRIRQLANCTVEQLRTEAQANRAEATLSFARARALEREARLREAGLHRQGVA